MAGEAASREAKEDLDDTGTEGSEGDAAKIKELRCVVVDVVLQLWRGSTYLLEALGKNVKYISRLFRVDYFIFMRT